MPCSPCSPRATGLRHRERPQRAGRPGPAAGQWRMSLAADVAPRWSCRAEPRPAAQPPGAAHARRGRSGDDPVTATAATAPCEQPMKFLPAIAGVLLGALFVLASLTVLLAFHISIPHGEGIASALVPAALAIFCCGRSGAHSPPSCAAPERRRRQSCYRRCLIGRRWRRAVRRSANANRRRRGTPRPPRYRRAARCGRAGSGRPAPSRNRCR
jgi:hypothetical protein